MIRQPVSGRTARSQTTCELPKKWGSIPTPALHLYFIKVGDNPLVLGHRSVRENGFVQAQYVITDGTRCCYAAIRARGNAHRREMGCYQSENSPMPCRRPERPIQRFRKMKPAQKLASAHASLHNHFDQARHLTDRQTHKERRLAALTQWWSLLAWALADTAKARSIGDKLRLD